MRLILKSRCIFRKSINLRVLHLQFHLIWELYRTFSRDQTSKLQVWTHKYLWNVKFLKPFHIQEIQSFGFFMPITDGDHWKILGSLLPLSAWDPRWQSHVHAPAMTSSQMTARLDFYSRGGASAAQEERCAARRGNAARRRDTVRTRGCALLQPRESLNQQPPATSSTNWKE